MAMAWQDLPRSHPWDEPPKQPQNKELLVRLQPEAKISGRVTDEAGRPLEGAEVAVSLISRLDSQLMDRSTDTESLSFNGSRLAPHATTDAEGRG